MRLDDYDGAAAIAAAWADGLRPDPSLAFSLWADLAGVTIDFEGGPLRLFQVVASKQRPDGTAPLPPTREDLCAADWGRGAR